MTARSDRQFEPDLKRLFSKFLSRKFLTATAAEAALLVNAYGYSSDEPVIEAIVRLASLLAAAALAFGYLRSEAVVDAADTMNRAEDEPPFGFNSTNKEE